MAPSIRTVLFSICLSAACHASTSQSSIPVNKEPIILPEYTVTAWRFDIDPEEWTYASWDDIEVISNAGDDETTMILKSMRSFQKTIEWLMPGFRTTQALPFYVIIHGPGSTRSALYKRAPLNKELGFFNINLDGRTVITISTTFERPSAFIVVPATLPSRGVRAAEVYFGYKAVQYVPPLPKWFHMVIKSLPLDAHTYGEWNPNALLPSEIPKWLSSKEEFAAHRAQNPLPTKVILGHMANDRGIWQYTRKGQKEPDYKNLDKPLSDKRRIRPIPMNEFFAWKYQVSKKYTDEFWLSQCKIFWHYCYLRKDAGKLKDGYMQLVRKAMEKPITEDIFRECMGMSFADMEQALFDYMGPERTKKGYEALTIYYRGSIYDQDLPLRRATRAEVARIKGEALAMQGNTDLARKIMLAIYDRKKADPSLCGSLGVLEYHAGDLEKARPLLAAAAQARVRNPEVYRALARIKLDEALGVEKGEKPKAGTRITAQQFDEIYTLLGMAREMSPVRAETYALLEELLTCAGTKPTAGQTSFMEEGRGWFPDGRNFEQFPVKEMPIGRRSSSSGQRFFSMPWTNNETYR